MNLSIGKRWEAFVENAVQQGRYASASEVVREGLRLVEEREAKLQSLRDAIHMAIEEGVFVTDEEIDVALAEVEVELRAQGYVE